MVLDTIKLKVGDYMTPDPISVDSKTSLTDAISIMSRKNIGNLVIEKNGKPSTILTEREILSYVVREGRIPEIMMKDVPTRRFAIISPNEPVIEAARIMLENKKRLLVFEDGEPVGIITVSDMLRGLCTTGGDPRLDDVMRGKVYGCSYHDSIFKAAKIMYSKKVGSVLISKDEKYQGIFTERDLLTKVLERDINPKDRLEDHSSFPLVTAKFGIRGNEAAEIMAVHKIKRLPLAENGKIKGIITARDVVDAFRRL